MNITCFVLINFFFIYKICNFLLEFSIKILVPVSVLRLSFLTWICDLYQKSVLASIEWLILNYREGLTFYRVLQQAQNRNMFCFFIILLIVNRFCFEIS